MHSEYYNSLVRRGTVIINNSFNHTRGVAAFGSSFRDFISKYEGEDGLQRAITALTALVEESKSEQAKELLEALVEELNGKKRKAPLKSAWNSLIEIIPRIKDVVEITSEISKMIL